MEISRSVVFLLSPALQLINPYSPGMLDWHCDNATIATSTCIQSWKILIHRPHRCNRDSWYKHIKMKPCAYLLRYIIQWEYIIPFPKIATTVYPAIQDDFFKDIEIMMMTMNYQCRNVWSSFYHICAIEVVCDGATITRPTTIQHPMRGMWVEWNLSITTN